MKEFLLLIETKYKLHSAIVLGIVFLVLFMLLTVSKGFDSLWLFAMLISYAVHLSILWNASAGNMLPSIDKDSSPSLAILRIIFFIFMLTISTSIVLEAIGYKTILSP